MIGEQLPELNTWIDENLESIKEAQAFTKEPLSCDAAKLYEQLANINVEHAKMGILLADIKSFLTQQKAIKMFNISKEYPNCNAGEKKILVDDAVREIKRLHDQLETIVKCLSDMSFGAMNLRKVYNSENHNT